MEFLPTEPSSKGRSDLFWGPVWVDPIVRGDAASRIRVNAVHFAPGARTAWHIHPVGQTLYITEGEGLAQARGGVIVNLRAGDVVFSPPGEEHWHGASPDHFMTHVSITEVVGDVKGPTSAYGAHVTEAEYLGKGSDPK